MTKENLTQFAIEYLYVDLALPKSDISNYRLNKRLDSKLKKVWDRFDKSDSWNGPRLLEKDIYILIEAWIMAQETHLDPLVPLNSPF
jgi:hypothetical protein